MTIERLGEEGRAAKDTGAVVEEAHRGSLTAVTKKIKVKLHQVVAALTARARRKDA